jgi:hypothetical protein
MDTILVKDEEIENYVRVIIITNNYSPLTDIGKIINSCKEEFGNHIKDRKLIEIISNSLK